MWCISRTSFSVRHISGRNNFSFDQTYTQQLETMLLLVSSKMIEPWCIQIHTSPCYDEKSTHQIPNQGAAGKGKEGYWRGGSGGVLIACCSCQSSPWLQCEKGWRPMRVDGSSGSLAHSGFHRTWGQSCSNQKRLSTFYGKYNPNTMM